MLQGALCPRCFCLADALMKKAFGSSSFNPNAFLTRLLIHMGLLKVRWEERWEGRRECPTGVLQGPAPHTVPGLALLQHLGRGALSGTGWWRPWAPGDLIAHLLLRVFPLQSEDKVKAIANLYGPLMALNHMVQQDYFPKALAPLLQAFMTK